MRLPLPDATADVVISNCVVNLVPDKPAVFREMLRILKPGGRVALSDIALKRPLPDELARSVAAYVGCVAGAIPVADYERMLRDAGFDAVQIVDSSSDLNAYATVENASGCCGNAGGSGLHQELADLISRYNVNDFAASVRVFALKPAAESAAAMEKAMKTLQVFDRPMCCSTGICGPSVDPVLPRFAADLAWLKDQGVAVERYNLAQQPQAFVAHADVKDAIREGHEKVLPIIRVNGHIVSRGLYPSRALLAGWCGLSVSQTAPSCGPAGCC